MAINGTQVPMYTKHTLFLYFFLIFKFLFLFLYQKQNKQKLKIKQKQEERKRKVIESLRVLFLPQLGRTFPLIEPFL